MPPSSNITTKNLTDEQVWAATKYGYQSRHNFALSRTSGPSGWVLTINASFRAAYREPLLRGIKTVDATIKAWWKRIYELIREMLVVERLRQLDDVEQRTSTGLPGIPIEAYSPIFQWLRGPRLNSAAGARDEVIAEFGGDAGKLASEILRLRTAMGQAANALTQASASSDIIF